MVHVTAASHPMAPSAAAMPHTFATPLDARFLRTRHALIEALRELLDKRAFDQVSIREITGKAKIGYATFYRHYATKEALLNDLAKSQIARVIDIAFPVVLVVSMRESLRALCSNVAENDQLWRALLAGGASGIVRSEFVRQVMRLRGRYDDMSCWMPEELHLACATGATIDVLAWWLAQKPRPSVEEVTGTLDRVIAALTVQPPRNSTASEARPVAGRLNWERMRNGTA